MRAIEVLRPPSPHKEDGKKECNSLLKKSREERGTEATEGQSCIGISPKFSNLFDVDYRKGLKDGGTSQVSWEKDSGEKERDARANAGSTHETKK